MLLFHCNWSVQGGGRGLERGRGANRVRERRFDAFHREFTQIVSGLHTNWGVKYLHRKVGFFSTLQR